MQESLVPVQGSDAHVAFLLSKAHDLASRAAPNTLRSHMADWQDLCEFAASIGVSALPGEPSTVAATWPSARASCGPRLWAGASAG